MKNTSLAQSVVPRFIVQVHEKAFRSHCPSVFLLIGCLTLSGCSSEKIRVGEFTGESDAGTWKRGEGGPATGRPPGKPRTAHERMEEELRRIARQASTSNPYLGTARKDSLLVELQGTPRRQPVQQAMLLNGLGVENLKLGDNRSAQEQFREADQLLSDFLKFANGSQRRQAEQLRYFVTYHRVLGWLRVAEQTNCVDCDQSESCLYPISAAGVHQDPAAAREALSLLDQLRAKRPDDLRTKWLQHLLGQLSGESGVSPKRIRAGNPGLEAEADYSPPVERIGSRGVEIPGETISRFRNIAAAKGVDSLDLSGGLAVEDYNGDGFLDLVHSTSDPTRSMKIFFGDGRGDFEERTRESNLRGMLGGLNLNHADYDNDGDVDLYVMRGAWWDKQGEHPNSLLRNDGQGRFEDVTFDVGLAEAFPSLVAAWADFDNDGDLDLFTGSDRSYRSRLYRNDGGEFVEVGETAGLAGKASVRGACWGDYDNDGFPDLYVSNLGDRNQLFRNNQDGTFTDQAFECGVANPRDSFACWFWDYNNDGQLDLFVASYSGSIENVAAERFGEASRFESPKLYQGDGKGFRDVTGEVGLERVVLAMGANFGDLDGDGYEDIYLGTGDPQFDTLVPNLFFSNRSGQSFEDQTAAGGLGHLQKGHGIAFADFDEDGDNDLFVQLGGAYKADRFRNALFENPGNSSNWLKIRLAGSQSNSSGIGVRLKLQLSEGDSRRTLFRHFSSGGSFGANPLRQEIGLGNASRIEALELYWPASGIRQVYRGMDVNQTLLIGEEEGIR